MLRSALTALALAAGTAATGYTLHAQGGGGSAGLVQVARRLLPHNPDSAYALLRGAMAGARTPADSVQVLVWTAIADFYAGRDSLTQASFRAALAIDTALIVYGLQQVSPRLVDLFDAARRGEQGRDVVYTSNRVDVPPHLTGGPAVVYPWEVWRRRVTGRAVVNAIVDTSGRVEAASLEVEQVPDSGLIEPVRSMILASTFTPGRVRSGPVRTLIRLGIELAPGPSPNPTELVTQARACLPRDPDSALALVDFALDPAVRATEAVRVYARLVSGIAWYAKGDADRGAASFDTALADYRGVIARGVDLAPFLRRLADSVQRSTRAAARSRLEPPTLVGDAASPPAVLRHPPIRYPPEMRVLRVGGTVVVEAILDTTGHVLPASVRVVQSPNSGLDAEARRVVLAAVYRPARAAGRPVRVTIRQPILFANY